MNEEGIACLGGFWLWYIKALLRARGGTHLALQLSVASVGHGNESGRCMKRRECASPGGNGRINCAPRGVRNEEQIDIYYCTRPMQMQTRRRLC